MESRVMGGRQSRWQFSYSQQRSLTLQLAGIQVSPISLPHVA